MALLGEQVLQMKHNHRDGFVFGPLESLFQERSRDARVVAMDLPEQFQLVRAQSRGTSLASQQLGELVQELCQ